jgi:hypothetical protein
MSDFSTDKSDRKEARFARKLPAAAWVAVGLLGAAITAPEKLACPRRPASP